MNNGKLDAWITGNYGESHPDNSVARVACLLCGESFDTRDADGAPLCETCITTRGAFVCSWCGDVDGANGLFKSNDDETICNACVEISNQVPGTKYK